MGSRSYGPEEKRKLEQLISDGVEISLEIEALQTGLSDTVKAVAEELDIKPSIIKKAIKIAQTGKWAEVYDDFDNLESIIDITGRK